MTREEAIKVVRNIYQTDTEKEALETLIPELAESEDEKIRKTLLEYFNERNSYRDEDETFNGVSFSSIIAYLEKLKESGIKWLKSDNVKNPDKPYIDKAGMFYTTDGRMCLASEIEKQKEQDNEECTDFTIYHPLKNGKGEYECIPYSFYGSLTSFSEGKDLIDFLRTCFYTEEECNEWIEQQKEQKPTEWSKREKLLMKALQTRAEASRLRG